MEIIGMFRKFGGEKIPNIIEYLRSYIDKDPGLTISVGCDSVQRRKVTLYAITVTIYNNTLKNGAHVVYFRERVKKIRDNFERLSLEYKYALTVSDILNDELSKFYERSDINLLQRQIYKYHLLRCDGKYDNISLHNIESFISHINLTEGERTLKYKLVDIHLDFNPSEGKIDSRGFNKNKSNVCYRSFVPWLRSCGYRVWVKPVSSAASSAADLLLK